MRKVFFLLCLLSASTVFASATDGTINGADKYAKALDINAGTINFSLSSGNVHVTDIGLTGYAWGNMLGWINLNPAYGGVTNNAEGTLNGYAWGEQTGWINFHPTNGGVTINSSGVFLGYAWSEKVGWIIFNCVTNSSCGSSDFKVSTDWRPASSRAPIVLGGGSPASAPSPAIVPVPTPEVTPEITPEITPEAPPEVTPPPEPAPVPVVTPVTPVVTVTGTIATFFGGGGFFEGTSRVLDNVTGQVRESAEQVKAAAVQAVKRTKEVVQSPVGSAVTKTVSTAGVVTTGAVAVTASLFVNPLSVSELFLIPFRLWALLLTTFRLKKRNRPWGTVYDSVTKQPLDPAYVVLKDIDGNEVADAITDLDGRFGFLLAPGRYRLEANKTNYVFPSVKLKGKLEDELYQDLYFGEEILVGMDGLLAAKNIPLDPVKFDWNEFAKGNQKLMYFYSKRDRLLQKVSKISFAIGFVVAIVALLAAPQPYNFLIFGTYCVLLAYKILGGGKQKALGSLRDKNTGEILAFAIIRVFSAETNVEMTHKVSDKIGRYYLLVPKGNYYVTIEKKNSDESYTAVHKSQVFEALNGVINRTFEI